MTTPSIVEFLRARIEEDRKLAQAAIDDIYGPDDCWFDTSNEHIVDHYRHHQPDRVLREVEAKRAMLRKYEDARAQARHPVSAENFEWARVARDELYDLIILFAAAYSDHPDYRADWKS
jgi:hypothetical protein